MVVNRTKTLSSISDIKGCFKRALYPEKYDVILSLNLFYKKPISGHIFLTLKDKNNAEYISETLILQSAQKNVRDNVNQR